MKKYKVEWSKEYYTHGTVVVEANSNKEAEKKVLDMLGDLSGTLQYDPKGDYAYATCLDKDEHTSTNK